MISAKEAGLNQREVREHRKHSRRSVHGRSTVDIDCPFCGETVTAYIWSLSGGGKKCPCGAVHGYIGTLEPLKLKEKKTRQK